jgi:3-hydroxyisobutyrate dehydrogenase
MSSNHANINVAFIGLGAIGASMAKRLIDSGFALKSYGVNEDEIAALEEAGGAAPASPAQTTANALIVLVMVPRAKQVTSALFAPQRGAVHGLTENATIILLSTVDVAVPQDVRHRLDSEYRRSDVVVLDAPVTGGPKEAEDGTLSIMLSAAKAKHSDSPEIQAVLSCMAQKVYHISGPLESALKVKLLSQLLCGIHLVAAAEIISLVAVLCLDTKRFYKYVASPGARLATKKHCWSWMFEDRVPRMLDYRLPLKSAMSNIRKDNRLLNREAEKRGVRLSLCKASQVVYEKAVKLGHKEDDDSAVFQVYMRREIAQGADEAKFLQTISEMGGVFPEDEAARLFGLLSDALAAIHAMAAYEALVFAESMHLCRTLKQCKQWIDVLGNGAAGSTMFIKGMPRVFDSETHGTGSLELLVPSRQRLLGSLVSSRDGAGD